MDLRHLRYFIAVAEERSFIVAAEKRLHVAQPSLSRQIRDLELEVGAQLIIRGPRGMDLTASGRVFLDQVKLALAQIDVACDAAKQAGRAAKASFVLGFLTGYELEWLPEVLKLLQHELHNTEIIIHSGSSPELTQALLRGEVDLAFTRPNKDVKDIVFQTLAEEALVLVLPENHPLAKNKEIDIQDIAGETFISVSKSRAPFLRQLIDGYLERSGVRLTPGYDTENLPMAISLVLSTPGVSLLPAYARKLLPPSVVSRPLLGDAPLIELAIAHNKLKMSPLLEYVLSRANELVTREPNSA
ncbi:LysR family hca operon transcriptional activator [Nitrobacteraceae bacterium AZCC 2161]